MIFYALSNAAYRVLLRGLGAELEGFSPPHQGMENLEAHQGAGYYHDLSDNPNPAMRFHGTTMEAPLFAHGRPHR